MTAATSDALQHFRPLAVARTWDDLRNAIRARCDELNVARTTVDQVGGLPSGQTAKLLAPVRDQGFGPVSFPAMLGALGLVVVVAEDGDAIERIRHRLTPRATNYVNAGEDVLARRKQSLANNWKTNPDWGRIMRARQLLKQGAHKRKQIARAGSSSTLAPSRISGGVAMTFCCCLCHARNIERRAVPVNEGVPLCVECRTAGAARVAADDGATAFAMPVHPLTRYATRLMMAGGLASIPAAGSA